MAPAPDQPPVACPCGHGDVPAELAAQRPLLAQAAAGDPEAFAHLWSDQVENVHRYLLAWTGDPARAADLTAQVHQSAPRWLPTPRDQVEPGAWLLAMARDATQDPTRDPGAAPPGSPGPPTNALEALTRLPNPQREVLVLRLRCGHSLPHTAHLSGYPRRTVLDLQLAACLAIQTLLGGPPLVGPTPSAEAFERHLEKGGPGPGQPGPGPEAEPGGDPFLSGALAVAESLRQAVPDHPVPTLTAPPLGPSAPPTRARFTRPGRGRVPRWGSVAQPGKLWDRLSTGWQGGPLGRRPWVATGVAVAGIVVVLALQAFGDHGPPPACGDRPCPVPTTAVVAAGAASSLGTAPTSVAEPSTTRATRVARPAAPRASTVATPPTTRPATTAPPATATPASTTTTAPPTTAPPTTAAPTTTTAPPVTT